MTRLTLAIDRVARLHRYSCHLREPGQTVKETFPPVLPPQQQADLLLSVPCRIPTSDDLPAITRWMQRPERGARVNVFPIAAPTVGSMGEQLTDYTMLKRAGAVAVTDDGKPILPDRIMREALLAAARVHIPVIQHAEDTRIQKAPPCIKTPTAFRLGLRGWPAEAESTGERDIHWRLNQRPLPRRTFVRSGGVERYKAKREHVNVTCEVTPHHFALIDEE